ncbi:MAG TPA: hypothetical protein VF015_09750, partial [Acidimicrobiales bacterium]
MDETSHPADEGTESPHGDHEGAVSPFDDDAPATRATRSPRFTRRQVITMAGATGLVGAGVLANWFIDDDPVVDDDTTAGRSPGKTRATTATAEAAPAGARWSDPATWGGKVPGPGDVAVVDRPVVLDVDAAVAGVRVEAGGELVFDPAASRTLTSSGNVVVAGILRAHPNGHDVQHVVVFPGIDEGRIVGDHTMEPLDTDVGLWVVGAGVLDAHGTPKRAWTRLSEPADAGATAIAVADAEGWRAGDEIVVTPTEPTTVEGYAEHHDRRTVTAVTGGTVELDAPLDFPHPAVTVRPGVTYLAEVLNLSRNVRIEGTPDGRAHVIVLDVSAPQSISYVGLRHMGPQMPHPEGGTQGVVGRYSLHFHMSYDATQGSLVEGVVAYDGGNHAFVPHLSHGITFRDCVAHDQADTAYWWDQPVGDEEAAERIPTNDLVYERCVAHLIRPTASSEYDVAGFLLAPGSGQVARGCVAVGVLADDQATPGFRWSGDTEELPDAWVFEDCLTHNNDGSSIYYWVNGAPPSFVDRFTAYQDRHGIRAGAYTNLVSYRDCTVYGCSDVGLDINAVPGNDDSGPERTVTYENIYIDQAGLSEFAVNVSEHVVAADVATKMTGCHFMGGTKAQ